ncbi:MAG: CPBP family intramembrane metalloprotease [Brevinematales bacterium]|nr:CPBP family intramembrane metalloprotease [Brevinematales bacterium]
MKKQEGFPLWATLAIGVCVFLGVPLGVSLVWENTVLDPKVFFLLIPTVQWGIAMSPLVFLKAENPTRKALFSPLYKPQRLALTILLSWLFALMAVGSILWIIMIIINMITKGMVGEIVIRDMIRYQMEYGHILHGIKTNNGLFFLWLFVILVFLVPLTEEWLFRGLLYEGLCRSLHARWAVILQALLFASLHPLGFYTSLYVGIGLFLGWFRKKFHSLWPGIWAHQFQNLMAFLTFLIGGEKALAIDPQTLAPHYLFFLVPFLGITGVMAVSLIKKLASWPVPVTTSTGEPWQNARDGER